MIREAEVRGGLDMLGTDLLKYIQPQFSIRFYLYGPEVLDGRLCVASSRVEDRVNVEEEFRLTRFELISGSLARQGVFKNTHMKVDVEGPFHSRAGHHLRLR